MKKLNWIIGWLMLASSITLSNWNINNVDIINVNNNIKENTKNILSKSSDLKEIKIYNPMNPDGIHTDDWYIYIV